MARNNNDNLVSIQQYFPFTFSCNCCLVSFTPEPRPTQSALSVSLYAALNLILGVSSSYYTPVTFFSSFLLPSLSPFMSFYPVTPEAFFVEGMLFFSSLPFPFVSIFLIFIPTFTATPRHTQFPKPSTRVSEFRVFGII